MMDWASLQIVLVLVLVAAVFLGFVRERLPPDIVALLGVAVLLAAGILSTGEFLAVFSNSAPVTIAAMFVLSAALERTGVIDSLGRQVGNFAGASPILALAAMMACVMVMSAFINNTPVVVILAPVAIGLAQTLKLAPSKLLIPLSFASIFGGTCTLIGTSTNILVDGIAQTRGLAPFGLFEISLLGITMGAIGIVYLTVAGRWLLPDRETLTSLLSRAADRHFVAEALVPLDSPLVGKSLKDGGLGQARGFDVIDVIRGEHSLRNDLAGVVLRAGDRLVIRSKMGDVLALREAGDLAFGGRATHAIEPIATRETVILEGIVGPQSRLAGRRVADLGLRRLYGAYVLALHRQGESVGDEFGSFRLQVGDTLLLEGPPESMRRLFDYQQLINLLEPSERPMRRGKARIAIGAVLLVVVLAALEVMPIAGLAVIAAASVIGLRCIEAEDAYRAVRWNILVLIYSMLALSVAMEKTGAARLIVEQFTALFGSLGPVAVLSAIYFLTSALTEVMSNNATAVLLTPIAIGLAESLGVDPRPFVVAVMFAASASFATPIGYQTNTFVYNAGGYRFLDFVKIGAPLNLLNWAVATLVIPFFWPLD